MPAPDTRLLQVGEAMPEGYEAFLPLVGPDGSKHSIPEVAMSLGLAGAADERRANILSSSRRGLPLLTEWAAPHDRKMVLCCYGPSLKATWRDAVSESTHAAADLWSTSNANGFLYQRGFCPTYHNEIDPRPFKATALDGAGPSTRFYLASRCSPAMFDKAGWNTTLYHLDVPEERAYVREALTRRVAMVPTAITAGAATVYLGLTLGYRSFSIHGMDCSFEVPEPLLRQVEPGKRVPLDLMKDIAQHAGWHYTRASDVMVVEPEGSGRLFATNMLLQAAMNDMFTALVRLPAGTFTFHGDGLMQTVERMSRSGK